MDYLSPDYYERDTVVFEVDDLTPSPAVAQFPAEDLIMQVNVNGEWHRRLPDLSGTPCDLPIDGQRNPPRRYELSGLLCPICHTPLELARAEEANRRNPAWKGPTP